MKNINIKLINTLQNAGLSDKETTVYIALLELGKGTVSQIARKAGINRTTGYDILDNLVSKNLISVSGKEPKQEYVAESPVHLREFIKREIAKKNETLKDIDSVIPELKSMQNLTGRPRVRFYEGMEGLREVYEDTLTATETILGCANIENAFTGFPGYFASYFKRRAAKGIFVRGIIPDTKGGRERKSLDKEENRESYLVPADKFNFIPEINIYDNKVMIASWREKLGIIIESSEIADAMKKIYELAWAEAKRLDGEIKI
ncbi:MAG: helix-turn-helix domain-containing protein [Patescibacteria group bacterium]